MPRPASSTQPGGGVRRLLAAVEAGRLLLPLPDQPNLVDLARALAVLAGGRAEADAAARALLAQIGPAEQYVFVLADGLGLAAVAGRPPASLLRRHLVAGLRTVFPSTTGAALSSLATGAWPAEHGVLAWYLYLPGRGLSIRPLPFDQRFSETPLADLGVPPAEVFPLEARLFGPAAALVVPAAHVASTYSGWQRGAATAIGYPSLDLAWDVAIEVAARERPRFLYCYLPQPDTAGHEKGAGSLDFQGEVERIERGLTRLRAHLPPGTRIVASADHGMLDVAEGARVVLSEGDLLLDDLAAPPTGEPRAAFFHVKAGREAHFRATFARRVGERFALLDAADTEWLGLLGPGPLAPEARARLGDYLAVALDGSVLDYERAGADDTPKRGVHGGLAPAEMEVPLVVL